MNKKLVIVESPNKIKSIEKYLGSNYNVMASVGHIVKLPSTGEYRLGIDIENWEPKYKIDPTKKEVIKKLTKASEKSSEVLIATDPDREGEAIADNLITFLNIKDKFKRIRFNEITKEAVNKAVENPAKLDQDLVDAQKTRRMLDRIIGYRLSGLIAKKLSDYPIRPTAGRVQSIALKLIVEREVKIDAFIPIKYFNLEAKISEDVIAKYYNPNSEQDNKEWIMPEENDSVMKTLTNSLEVKNIKVSKRKDAMKSPFKQSVLYKASESSLGLSSKQTQFAAQKLYEGYGEGGLISYPRTDSTRMSDTFVKKSKIYLEKKYSKEYVSDNIKGVAGAQDAHEAIRPTDISLTPEKAKSLFKLKTLEFKVYNLIYTRTIQSLMTQPIREIIRYELLDGNNQFKMSSSKVIFDGYLKATGYDPSKELPKFKKGEVINVIDYINEEKATKPPARYNEGSIIEQMDNIGVGRPSTFSATVNKIKERGYVEKEGRALKPTEFGKIVNFKLINHFPEVINETYTAEVEKELDKIADGNHKLKATMQSFWDKFNKTIDKAEQTMEHTKLLALPASEEPCPEDGGILIFKRSRKGQKFIACKNFPKCRYTQSIAKPKFQKK
ncbi:MAG: type I DNA topoisomerase [Mycoplasma sp.]|nr:type I DNA topoisomerase [Mycoplasma sp.]